ncbi:aminotransferase [Colletotrichum graminicola]|nr:aminotransferase [Colletotrichum graminicola]
MGYLSFDYSTSAYMLGHRLRLQTSKADQADEPTLKVGRSCRKIYKYVIYLVPTFSNPSRITLLSRLRNDLVLIASEYDALIVSDDVYDFMSWVGDPYAQGCIRHFYRAKRQVDPC